MVDVMGHFAMALLWALPAWFVWDGRVSLTLILLTAGTAMLPDVDLVLQGVLPITHHGITHTVVFVVGVALVAGAIVEYAFGSYLRRTWLSAQGYVVSERALFALVASALTLGGFSHLFADLLSAPDIAPPIAPLWPVYDQPIIVDVIYYNSPWWNVGLLIAAVALHLAAAYADFTVEHPYRIERTT